MTARLIINLPDHGASGERMSIMANEFKAIETQEELDRIITERLDRNKKTVTAEVTKQFEGYTSPDDVKKLSDKISELEKQLGEKENSISELTAANKKYETASVKARIAHEKGLPFELAQRLSGETEEEIVKDAETLGKYFTANRDVHVAPLFQGEVHGTPVDPNTTDAALLSVLNELSE